jgi:AraC family transcriptional regulator, transcriptional activator of pobA
MVELQIQNFNLFGESGDLPDVVHCETIAFRSHLHDWQLPRHRHARLHQVLLIEEGGGQAEIEGEHHVLAPASFINLPAGIIHGFSFHESTVGWVITMGVEALDQTLQDNEGLRPVLSRAHIGHDVEGMKDVMVVLFKEFSGRRFARAHVLRSLTGVLLGLVAQRIFEGDEAVVAAPDRPLQRRFEALVEEEFLAHWNVSDYAQKLGLSPTHLSRVIRTTTGLPASRVIEARMLREARRLLAYTNLTVSQVAYRLGYNDPAYFSRFFTKATGLSPRAFRAQIEVGETTRE